MKLILICKAHVKYKKQIKFNIELLSKLGLINIESVYESNIE
jgi:hypothetical protein